MAKRTMKQLIAADLKRPRIWTERPRDKALPLSGIGDCNLAADIFRAKSKGAHTRSFIKGAHYAEPSKPAHRTINRDNWTDDETVDRRICKLFK